MRRRSYYLMRTKSWPQTHHGAPVVAARSAAALGRAGALAGPENQLASRRALSIPSPDPDDTEH
jgi:hypothetical protein